MSGAHPTDRAFAPSASSPPVSPVPASIPCATICSDVYYTSFYGILNHLGQFWTPMPFASEGAAHDWIERFWDTPEAIARFMKGAKIVPVHITLEAIAIEAEGGDAKQGSVACDESAAIAQDDSANQEQPQ